MNSRARTGILAVAAMTAGCVSASGQAYKVRPELVRPRPAIVLGGTLGLSATPGVVNFSLAPGGTAQGSSGVTITTTWNVLGLITTMNLYGYFASANGALSDGRTPADLIPSSAVFGQVSTGMPTSYTAFTEATPYSGASGLQLYSQSSFLTLSGNRTDVMNLKINLSNVPNLPPGTYTGTLTLQVSMN